MLRFLLLAVLCWVTPVLAQTVPDTEIRAKLNEAILADEDGQEELIQGLAVTGSPLAAKILGMWRQGELFIDSPAAGDKIPFSKENGTALRIDTGAAFTPEAPKELDASTKTRKFIRSALDLFAVADPDPKIRAAAVQKLGSSQADEYLPVFTARLGMETDKDVKKALEIGIATIQLTDRDDAVCTAALQKLAELRSLGSVDLVKAMTTSDDESDAVKAEAGKTLAVLEGYEKWVHAGGVFFSGLSAGSVLLVVALGLAITFGLMGVINMAHGEMIVIGAYTTYLFQNIFGNGMTLSMFGYGLNIPGMKLTGAAYQSYFIWSIPAAFLFAALVGIALERGVIRFLYKRPLESLLATWGISLILQQLFRLIFGPNNVQVSSPSYLRSSFVVSDVVLGYNRIFVICCAIAIVFLTWFLLTKTRLGLFIRAVMQNRQMAACMGVRTERVNMLTFGFGSGLAGLGGAFLSQLDNVGPGLGQKYIVDSFMTVVVGGVGNLIGTVSSAMGLGTADQTLEALTDPSMGKVITLGSIILFLLWRPGGLFPTRTRSLEG